MTSRANLLACRRRQALAVRFVGWWDGLHRSTPRVPSPFARLAALRGALDVALRVPVRVERAEAADWLVAKLGRPVAGAATVVFRSIVWQYLALREQRRVRALIEDAGSRAGYHGRPVRWLT